MGRGLGSGGSGEGSGDGEGGVGSGPGPGGAGAGGSGVGTGGPGAGTPGAVTDWAYPVARAVNAAEAPGGASAGEEEGSSRRLAEEWRTSAKARRDGTAPR